MNRIIELFILFLLFTIFILPCLAQESQSNQNQLPQIKLEDYTIIGLEKVVLPRKVRRTMEKKLELDWSQNTMVMLKESPEVSFKSDEKPGVTFLYDFPYIDADIEYGSFNTIDARLNAKAKAGTIIPFIGIDFGNSQGHVDNADYTNVTVNGGLEGQLWQNSVFQLTARFRKDKQSLWSNQIPVDSSWKNKITVWNWQANIDQKLSEEFSMFAGGNFQVLEYENRFDYNQNYLSVNTGLIFSNDNTSVIVQGILDHNNSEPKDNNLNQVKNSSFNKTDYSLYSTYLKVLQRINSISVGAGIKAQHLNIKNGSTDSKTELYPLAELSFSAQNSFHINVKYQPGLEFQAMERMLEEHRFADFGSYQPIKRKHKILGDINLKVTPNLEFAMSSSYSEFENYPILYSSYFDTSAVIGPPQVFSSLNYKYPYWEYRYINNAKILENSVGFTYFSPNQFSLGGWLTYRWDEIHTVDEKDSLISGNEIPYLPSLEGNLRFDWFFFNKHRLRISAIYVGEQYNDVENFVKLKDYLLLSASVNFIITEQFTLKFFGNNLLDQDFDLYNTYIAPGISGGAGIEIKF